MILLYCIVAVMGLLVLVWLAVNILITSLWEPKPMDLDTFPMGENPNRRFIQKVSDSTPFPSFPFSFHLRNSFSILNISISQYLNISISQYYYLDPDGVAVEKAAPIFTTGDTIGCWFKLKAPANPSAKPTEVDIIFTKNGAPLGWFINIYPSIHLSIYLSLNLYYTFLSLGIS